jgi:hypothetical protein
MSDDKTQQFPPVSAERIKRRRDVNFDSPDPDDREIAAICQMALDSITPSHVAATCYRLGGAPVDKPCQRCDCALAPSSSGSGGDVEELIAKMNTMGGICYAYHADLIRAFFRSATAQRAWSVCPHCGNGRPHWAGVPYCQQPWSGDPAARPHYPGCILRGAESRTKETR